MIQIAWTQLRRHLIGAIERADRGVIEVDGINIAELGPRRLSAYRRTIGFVFQHFHLLPALTALQNVVVPLLPYRLEFDRVGRARELLEAVGLAGRENALPSQLSGGQQQRVAIASIDRTAEATARGRANR